MDDKEPEAGTEARLLELFAALSSTDQALFLLRVAHHETVHARAAAHDLRGDAAIEALRRGNEYVHRLTGCTRDVLARSTDAVWQRSVLRMVIRVARERSAEELRLVQSWLGASAPVVSRLH